jgi:hypothetical protein
MWQFAPVKRGEPQNFAPKKRALLIGAGDGRDTSTTEVAQPLAP